VLPDIRRFILEHIQELDTILADLKRAGATVSRNKSQFYMTGIKMVEYVCDFEGRHPDVFKVIKILE